MKVLVKTPARLHFGLIDLNGVMGRFYGGIGVGIDKPNVVVEVKKADKLSFIGIKNEKIEKVARSFMEIYKIDAGAKVDVKNLIPEHIGLGSGTQMTLAVTSALSKLFNIKVSTKESALQMGRIQRTGVGTTIFERGGFVVDGGKDMKNNQSLPPVIFQRKFPKEWNFLVAVPNVEKGLSNDKEDLAFKHVPKMPKEDVGEICHLILMKLLPTLIEKDIKKFGESLTQIQNIIGDKFSKVQHGRYSNANAFECLEVIRKNGAFGVGQSSWGPTLYGLFNKKDVHKAQKKIQHFFRENIGGYSFIANPNNNGAKIKILT